MSVPFNPMDPEFLADPYAFYAGLHDRCPPIFYNPSSVAGDTWVTIKHATAFHALRDAKHFRTRTEGVVA